MITLLTIVLLTCTHAWSSKEWWVSSSHKDYPTESYWVGVGQASNAKLARQYASQEIAKQFQQSISTRNRDTQVETKSANGKRELEEFYYSKTTSSTHIDLQGIEYPLEQASGNGGNGVKGVSGVNVLAVISKVHWLKIKLNSLDEIEHQMEQSILKFDRALIDTDLSSSVTSIKSLRHNYSKHQMVIKKIMLAPSLKTPSSLDSRVSHFRELLSQKNTSLDQLVKQSKIKHEIEYQLSSGFGLSVFSVNNKAKQKELSFSKTRIRLEYKNHLGEVIVREGQSFTGRNFSPLNIPIGTQSIHIIPDLNLLGGNIKSWQEENTIEIPLSDYISKIEALKSNKFVQNVTIDFISKSNTLESQLSSKQKTQFKINLTNYLKPYYIHQTGVSQQVQISLLGKVQKVNGFSKIQKFWFFEIQWKVTGLKSFKSGNFKKQIQAKDLREAQNLFLNSILNSNI